MDSGCQMSKIILTVSELNLATQRLLEENFPCTWVEGEISNLSKPVSGHYYFSLKDTQAQIRCALFRHKSQHLSFEPKNGLLVQVQAKVSLYTDRGDYQLIVNKIELSGDGLLKKAYEALILKLTREGLFDQKWKKPIPDLPRRIGVITSTTGAAIRDILSVLKRRFPSIPIIIYPATVQGLEAKLDLINALEAANAHNVADVLILARGGGSLEDLWPFNEESVARSIFASRIPIITGIGHEIDFTIADFVADKRASTPSAAAELAAPLQCHLQQQFALMEKKLINAIQAYLQHQMQRLDWLIKHIRHPGQQIAQQLQRLKSLKSRLQIAIRQFLKEKNSLLKMTLSALETVSPIATLDRGYAIVSLKNGEIIRSVYQLQLGEPLSIRLKDGIVVADPLSHITVGEEKYDEKVI